MEAFFIIIIQYILCMTPYKPPELQLANCALIR